MASSKNNDGHLGWMSGGVVILLLICVLALFHVFRKPAPMPPARPAVAKAAPRPAPARAAGYITVILDDWGYNRSHCRQLAALDAPVVAAILPGLEYSADVLQCAIASGHEAILHLPIEPHIVREKYPRGYFLTGAMSSEEIRRSVKRTLDAMKGVVGVNNHEGSKGTENRSLMTAVLTELKQRGLFFVDSVTSDKTVCSQVAAGVKIPFARRDVFLDNRLDRTAIERQFSLAARVAKERGFALVIGHDRALTLQVLSEQIPRLRQQGFVFLSLKDYIKARRE